ncbi:glycine oxidase [Bacillus sp. TS-2]|nr:glycine oxidase [Bacillus sp. TS-2]
MAENICILGGGVIGLAVAYELTNRGFTVKILEKSKCGGQASGAAAGMLAPFSEIGEDPDDFFRLCLESLRLYPNWITKIKEDTAVDFEYTNSGSLYVVYHEADILALETRKNWQNQWGANAELLMGDELKNFEPELSDEIIAALYYPQESHVYAPGYVAALEAACRKNGVEIYEDLGHVKLIETQSDYNVLQSSDGQSFTEKQLIICSGAWAKELEDVLSIKLPIYPIRGQICAYQSANQSISHIVYSSQGYIVPKENGTLVNGASEDIAGFQTNVTEKGIQRLTNWNHKIFPFLKEETPFHYWAGLRPATQDGYPFIGSLPNHKIIFATGHYRNGILLSPVTANIIADLIEDKQPVVSIESFQPLRFT